MAPDLPQQVSDGLDYQMVSAPETILDTQHYLEAVIAGGAGVLLLTRPQEAEDQLTISQLEPYRSSSDYRQILNAATVLQGDPDVAATFIDFLCVNVQKTIENLLTPHIRRMAGRLEEKRTLSHKEAREVFKEAPHKFALQFELEELGEGRIPNDAANKIVSRLMRRWDSFGGRPLEGHKLDRAEDLRWEPPELTFKIERHGAKAKGSIYAEVQEWTVNLHIMRADCEEVGRRQVRPQQPGWSAEPVAEKIAHAILNKETDPRIEWDGPHKVGIRTKEFVPLGPRDTVAGRKRRFYKKLDQLLEAYGWKRGRYVYRKTDE